MFDLIATPVATVLKAIHSVLSTFLIPSSGPAWVLSIVLLVVFVRLLLFPLFVKQIKSQRRMQELAPRLKELQKLHKGDRETLQREQMKLYKDNNANPIAGCLPLLIQLPVFFSLFTVLKEFKPGAVAKYGLSAEQLREGGMAKLFGAPISAALNSPLSLIRDLGGTSANVRVVAVVMLVLMGSTTFYTQRQMMARNAGGDKMQMQVQKVMLYILPFSFAIFGFSFPIGVLLYWLTTNIWSMGQQAYVIKRMPPPNLAGGSPGRTATGPAGTTGTTEKARGGGGGSPGGSWRLFGGRGATPTGGVTLTKGGSGEAGPQTTEQVGSVGGATSGVAGTGAKRGQQGGTTTVATPASGRSGPGGRTVSGPGRPSGAGASKKKKGRRGGRH